MKGGGIIDSVLILASTEKNIVALKEMLRGTSIHHISTVATAGEARRLLIENDYDLCIINAPLPDEHGQNLACNIASKGISQVFLLVKAEVFEEISEKVEDYGVITIAKPINRVLLGNAFKLAGATHKKMRNMQKENQKLLQKIEDIRIVDRAKCILISYLAMTEPEAHKYIERQAMDMRITRRDVAEEILKTYEN